MFQWLWIVGWSAVMLPLGGVLLAGRAPRWLRRDSTLGVLRVKGIAAFVLYLGLMVPPTTALAGIQPEAAELLRMALVPTALFAGHGLILGATLCERFNRREAERAPTVPAIGSAVMSDARGGAS
ncbi:hypothetical protein [Streptomyces sp. NPDC051310]|uniref:hypothetical protein n=1 Tax=Streptomyces sp. NPDC051310 TaxID=3365649 RepID=UPI0037A157D0